MCGICGFINHMLDVKEAKSIAWNMCRSMIHRGPDEEGFFVDSNIALGMRRLRIIDLQTGSQPIFNEDGKICVIANGEIYNFRELRDDLIKDGHIFSTNSDSEVLVHLYEKYGVECLDRLNGMFAFAIWDSGNRQLFIARDRIGIKPLYYGIASGRFVFGSELKALMACPWVERELDYQALSQYLTFEFIPSPLSILKSVKKLPPGHYILTDAKGRHKVRQYWDLDYREKIIFQNDRRYVDEMLYRFSKAVKRRMISDVPLGTFLSGGIDSGMIAGTMCKVENGRPDSFNIGFAEKSFDESEHARALAGHLGLNHRYRTFDGATMISLLPEVIDLLDEPMGDNSFLPTYLLCKYCRKYVTVALSGDGGDELFAGYPTYQAHVLFDYYNLIPRGFQKRIIEKAVMALPVSTRNFSFDFKAKKFISSAGYTDAVRHVIWMGAFSPREQEQILNSDIWRSLRETDVLDVVSRLLKNANVETRLDTLLYLDMKLYLQEDLLVKVDRASMANSLEVRVPFLDHEFVEFITRLPDRMKLRYLQTKYLLKKAAMGIIPERHIRRKKKGFGTPVAQWIKTGLKEIICDTFAAETIKRQGIFDEFHIRNLLEDHLSGRADNRQKIWTLFVFMTWYRNYMEN